MGQIHCIEMRSNFESKAVRRVCCGQKETIQNKCRSKFVLCSWESLHYYNEIFYIR